MSLTWQVGVTTIPERRWTTLPATLRCLEAGGFPPPHLFVDGCLRGGIPDYSGLVQSPITFREDRIRLFGNWWAGMVEMYCLRPDADRYTMFQDDVACVRNLREYLDQCQYPTSGYWNLYTAMDNERLVEGKRGWIDGCNRGRGALGLVFSREALQVLLTSPHFATKPLDARRGWRCVDGAVVQALSWMHRPAIREYVHAPSLLQHTGADCPTPGRYEGAIVMPQPAKTYPGDQFDAMELLR